MNSPDADDLKHAAARFDVALASARSPLRRLQFTVMAVLMLFWSTVIVIVIATFALTAWSDRGGTQGSAATIERTARPTATEAPRPAGVPSSAQMVSSDLVLGDVADFIYFFRDAQCTGDLLIISTSKAVVYAETACSNRITPEDLKRLAGQPMRIRLVGRRLFIEALFVNSFQFDVGRVWVESR